MANWSLPTAGDLYTAVINLFKERDDAAATQFDSAIDTSTNIPYKTKRWNATKQSWDSWSGTAWVDLSSKYGISISGKADTAGVSENSSKLGGFNANLFIRTVSGSGPDVNGNIVIDTSSKVSKTGDTMSGELTVSGADLTVYRPGGAAGYLNFNAAKTRSISFDGTYYQLPGAELYVNGSKVKKDSQFVYSDPGTNPTFVWGTDDGVVYKAFPPSRFSVNYAATAGSATVANSASNMGGYYSVHVARSIYTTSSMTGNSYHIIRFTRNDGTFWDVTIDWTLSGSGGT